MEEKINLYFCGLDSIMSDNLVYRDSKGQSVTSSLLVAKKFGKRHADVLRDIHNLEEKITEVSKNECKRNFALTSQLVEQPNGGFRDEGYYMMTRDGFSLLVMGFTGTEALRFKLDFIKAFNRMETTLQRGILEKESVRGIVKECINEFLGSHPDAPNSIERLGVAAIELDVREDERAYRFFDSYCPDAHPDSYLDKQSVAEYYANACVLNAIAHFLKKTYGVRGRSRRYNQVVFWVQAAKAVQRVDISKWTHSLPTSSRRLRAKYFRYLKDGYEFLIHRSFGNQNARK
ncbi:MAG: Rha family transcriptional regulator [Bacteroidales bacterium]|jgi:Rha family phage regulatory protein|nr:Rha family transcriptional regulator [Bacteroidales bacterium]